MIIFVNFNEFFAIFLQSLVLVFDLWYVQSVLRKSKCMCSSSHVLCYGHVQSCAIHNSFASSGGISFVLVVLTDLNVSELEY